MPVLKPIVVGGNFSANSGASMVVGFVDLPFEVNATSSSPFYVV
jgi:hypothetical protein